MSCFFVHALEKRRAIMPIYFVGRIQMRRGLHSLVREFWATAVWATGWLKSLY